VTARVLSRQQRIVLARLALSPNEVVSRDALIDAVWGERPPVTAEKALQVHVSQLRKLLEPRGRAAADAQLLVTRAPG
jgi:DNA-binding SARP family transcriptional activator